jgi:hypothetical protein
MPENKTIQTNSSVAKFLDKIPDETKRQDSYTLVELMEQATGEPPKMWGTAIVGFGSYHYKYESGREGDSPLIGFSPRKQNLTLYLVQEWDGYEKELAALGKHTTSKYCLYIKKLSDINMPALKKLINTSAKQSRKRANQK